MKDERLFEGLFGGKKRGGGRKRNFRCSTPNKRSRSRSSSTERSSQEEILDWDAHSEVEAVFLGSGSVVALSPERSSEVDSPSKLDDLDRARDYFEDSGIVPSSSGDHRDDEDADHPHPPLLGGEFDLPESLTQTLSRIRMTAEKEFGGHFLRPRPTQSERNNINLLVLLLLLLLLFLLLSLLILLLLLLLLFLLSVG